MDSPHVAVLAGRWIASKEGSSEETMVIVAKEGTVSFVGSREDGLLLTADPAREGHFVLKEGQEQLAEMQLEWAEDGLERLRVSVRNGGVECWRRPGHAEGNAKVVRRKNSRNLERRWTKENQQRRGCEEIVLPNSPGAVAGPASLATLTGRWMAVKNGNEEGMVILSEEGHVTFVGETAVEQLYIMQAERADHFVMREEGVELASLRFERPFDGVEDMLHVMGQDGGSEIWHRVGSIADATPKNVRRVPARDLRRRWTKENQQRRNEDNNAEDDDADYGGPMIRLPTGDAGFALHVQLNELAGRWMAVRDGVDEGMVLISDEGAVTFVGDGDDAALQLMVDPSEPSCFGMYEGTERLAGLRFQRPPRGPELLHVTGEMGDNEVWRSMGPPESPSPKSPGAALVRRVPARDMKRRWTKEDQARRPQPLALPESGDIPDEPTTLQGLAGRWMAVKDGHEEGMVIISTEGDVTFVGGHAEEPLKIAAGPRPGDFVMSEESEQIASLELHKPADGGQTELHVHGQDGGSETWYRVNGILDATPKNVRPVTPTNLVRRWTKQNQVGHAHLPEVNDDGLLAGSSSSTAGSRLPVGIPDLAGRWMAVKDGKEEGMLVISQDGSVTFVAEPDAAYHLSHDAEPGCFILAEGSDRLGSVCFERLPSGQDTLHVAGDDTSEVWHRAGGGAQSPSCSDTGRRSVRRDLQNAAVVRSAFEQSGATTGSMIDMRYFREVLLRLNPALTSEAVDQLCVASGIGEAGPVDLDAFLRWLFDGSENT